MNINIKKYFEEIEILLINSEIIRDYEILRKDFSDNEGKIRIRLELTNNDTVDLFEYTVEEKNKLISKKYHYHWQDQNRNIVLRWDNAPHHKELDNFPHHLHINDKVESLNFIPDIIIFIKNIENLL